MSKGSRCILFRIAIALALVVSSNVKEILKAQEPVTRRRFKINWITPRVRAPRLRQVIFYSKAAGTEVSYFIYTPRLYDIDTQRRFPVLYWLHGSGGGLQGLPWLTNYFDNAISTKQIPPMLIVFPNGLYYSMWCDSKDGRIPMETVLIKELIPQIDTKFRTIARREARIIEGFSMGGYGAARLGFKYPDLFGAVSILAGGPLQREFKIHATPRAKPMAAQRLFKVVYGGDQQYFIAQSPWFQATKNADKIRRTMRIRIIVGDRDETLENNVKFHTHLTRLKIDHTFTVLPGVKHSPTQLLEALGGTNWKFYRSIFGKP